MKSKVIYVTKSGVVYERTDGLNTRLRLNEEYPLEDGCGIVLNRDGDSLVVNGFRYPDSNREYIYTLDITETGFYIVTHLFGYRLIKRPKGIRLLHRELKARGKATFLFEQDPEQYELFTIKMILTARTISEPKFIISLKGETVTDEESKEIFRLIDTALEVDMHMLFNEYYSKSEAIHSLTFDINDDFFKMVEQIKESYKVNNTDS